MLGGPVNCVATRVVRIDQSFSKPVRHAAQLTVPHIYAQTPDSHSKETTVAYLVAIVYPDEYRAAEAMSALKRLQSEYLLDLEDACWIITTAVASHGAA